MLRVFFYSHWKKRNHYNIKFLKGYGHSISVKDSKIVLKNCSDPFASPEIESWHINRMSYEKIVLSGKGYVSTEALAHYQKIILSDSISEIGKFSTVEKQVNLNTDRKRLGLGKIESINQKGHNDSVPISLNFISKQ